jgi:hypothetical protein
MVATRVWRHQLLRKREARILAVGSEYKQAHALDLLEGDQKVIEREMVATRVWRTKSWANAKLAS